jgi:hypothetical protein
VPYVLTNGHLLSSSRPRVCSQAVFGCWIWPDDACMPRPLSLLNPVRQYQPTHEAMTHPTPPGTPGRDGITSYVRAPPCMVHSWPTSGGWRAAILLHGQWAGHACISSCPCARLWFRFCTYTKKFTARINLILYLYINFNLCLVEKWRKIERLYFYFLDAWFSIKEKQRKSQDGNISLPSPLH